VNGIMVGGFDSPVATGIDGSFVHPRAFYAEMTRARSALRPSRLQELTIGPGWHADALPKILAASSASATSRATVLRRERWDLLHDALRRGGHREPSLLDVRRPALAAVRSRGCGAFRRRAPRRLSPARRGARRDRRRAAVGRDDPGRLDHGFGGAGTSVLHLNRWLADHGWLAFRPGRRELGARVARGVRRAALAFLPRGLQERLVRRGGRALARRLESWSRFGAIDMARTRAFSEELNYAPSIWLNVPRARPRRPVAPGAEYDALVAGL
jgi:hypothetical protein